jgi:hypothetical protein
MRRFGALLLGSSLVLGLGGCSFNPGPAGSGIASSGTGPGNGASSGSGASSGGGGSSGHGGSTGSGTGNHPGGGDIGTNDGGCGQATYSTQNLPGEVLIVQDRSESMTHDFADKNMTGPADPAKWPAMTSAINTVVMATQGMIDWGLMFFSQAGDTVCTVATKPDVSPAPNNATKIANAIAGANPGSYTPTTAAMNNAVAYMKTLTDPNPKYILLATDGMPNCAPGQPVAQDDSAAAIQAVADSAAAGIPVFVVGIGNVSTAVDTLNSMATKGGKALATPDAMNRVYYGADDPTSLENALQSIGGMIKGCTFTLTGVPPDPTNIVVLGDNKQIAKDPVNGWSYGPNMTSVVLNGQSCQDVMNNTIMQVQTIFGCPNVPIIVP